MRSPRTLAVAFTVALVMSALFAVTPAQAAARPAALTINWTILLSGPSFNGENPTGNSDYEVENGAVKFSADCDNVNLADGTMLNVLVNGKTVGSFALQGGGGALLLTGKRAPAVHRGTKVSINHNGAKIVSGHF